MTDPSGARMPYSLLMHKNDLETVSRAVEAIVQLWMEEKCLKLLRDLRNTTYKQK